LSESPDDNHEVKFSVFNNFRKSEEFAHAGQEGADEDLAQDPRTIKQALKPHHRPLRRPLRAS